MSLALDRPERPDIRVIVIASQSTDWMTITGMIRRYTSPEGDVIFDHMYNAGSGTPRPPGRVAYPSEGSELESASVRRVSPTTHGQGNRWRGQPMHDALDGAFPVGSRRGQPISMVTGIEELRTKKSRDRAASGASRSPITSKGCDGQHLA
jgi:hypothetical protein